MRSFTANMGRCLVHRSCLFLAVTATLLPACADFPARPDAPAGRMVIAIADTPPPTNFNRYAVNKPAGTSKVNRKVAERGGTLAIAEKDLRAAPNPHAAVIAPYLAVAEVATVARKGVAIGSFNAIKEATVQPVNELMRQQLPALSLHPHLARSVAATTRRDTGRQLEISDRPQRDTPVDYYSPLSRSGVETVLELRVTEVGFEGGKSLRFYLAAQVRLIRASDGKIQYVRDFVYISDRYAVRQWRVHDAALFAAELQRANVSIGLSIVEQIFLFTSLPLTSHYLEPGKGIPELVMRVNQACGLAWREPGRDFRPRPPDNPRGWNYFTPVDSLRPVLQWESFPRRVDRHENHAPLLKQITNIRYDLRLWQVKPNMPPELIYQRRGLRRPRHRIEQALVPGARYYWISRARFDIDGQTHALRWSAYRTPYYDVRGIKSLKPQATPAIAAGNLRDPCGLDFIPTVNYYRFETPTVN